MAFSKALLSLVVAFAASFVHSDIALDDLSGVWRGYFRNTATNAFTAQGPTLVCVESLSPECREQIPFVEDTYTFNGSTISLEIRDRIGITTKEQAAAVMPACAAEGIYPFERKATVPPSQIISYDSKAKRIYYIDPRRPEEVNCLPVRYGMDEGGVYLEIGHFVTYQGSIADSFARGISFGCEPLPEKCFRNVDSSGDFDVGYEDVFNITCIAGNCLNLVKAAAPSAAYGSNESSVDI